MDLTVSQLRSFSTESAVPDGEEKTPVEFTGSDRQRKREEEMKRVLIVMAVALVCGFVAVPAAASDPGWTIRVFAAGFDPDLDVVVPSENPDEIRVTADSDLGFGASLEYRFNDLVGLELGYLQASPAIELSADIPGYGHLSLSDSMSTAATTLDLNFHLTPGSPYFDFYLGAGIAYMSYGDLHYIDPDGDPLDLQTDNDLGYAAKAGLGISLGKNSNWAAIGGLRYLWTDLEASQVQDLEDGSATFDFDTFSFTVGISYSF
jgi:opacity protein-like surface antigen